MASVTISATNDKGETKTATKSSSDPHTGGTHTSDKAERPNTQAAVTLGAIPTRSDDNARISTMYMLQTNLNLILTNKSKTLISVIDRNASYSHGGMVGQFNKISAGVNSVTASTLPTWVSLDYGAFNSTVARCVTAMTTINT